MPHRIHWNKTYKAMAILTVAIVGSLVLGMLGAGGWSVIFGIIVGIPSLVMMKHHQRRYRKTMPKDEGDDT